MGPSAEDGRFGGCRKMGFFWGVEVLAAMMTLQMRFGD